MEGSSVRLQEKLGLATELGNDATRSRERHRPHDQHLSGWKAEMVTVASAPADLTCKREKRVPDKAKITKTTTVIDISIAKVRTIVHRLTMTLAKLRSDEWHRVDDLDYPSDKA